MPLEGHQSIHTRPLVLKAPVDTAPFHTRRKALLQESDTSDTLEPEADDQQDLETATFLGSIWNLFKDTKELSQELLKDTKELATRELDTLLDRLPFGQAKSKDSEDADASSEYSTTTSSRQQRPQHRHRHQPRQPRQPLRTPSTSLGYQTQVSNPPDAPVLPIKKTGKLSRESSVSRTREPSLYGEKKDQEVKKVSRETLEMPSSTRISSTEDKPAFTYASTTVDPQLDFSLMHPSGALYLSSQELPPSPTLRIQRNRLLLNLSRSDELPVEDTHDEKSPLGMKSITASALVATSSPPLPILSTVPVMSSPPPPSLSPSPPSLTSQEADDKLSAVLKELADMKQQVQGFQALKEQVGQIEAIKNQIAGLVSSRETVARHIPSTPDRHKSPPSPPPPPPSINNKWFPNKSAMDNVLQELRSPRTPLRQTNSPFLKRVLPAVAHSPLVSRVANSPPAKVADDHELGWPTPERMREAVQRLDDAAKELCRLDVPRAITPAKRTVTQQSIDIKEQMYKPKKSKLTRPLPPRATKTIVRLPLSELTSPTLNQNRSNGGLDSSSLNKDSKRVSIRQDISDVERQWYLECDKDSWRVND